MSQKFMMIWTKLFGLIGMAIIIFIVTLDLDMYLDKEEHITAADFRPFPTKLFAMLYILLHGPRPMVKLYLNCCMNAQIWLEP